MGSFNNYRPSAVGVFVGLHGPWSSMEHLDSKGNKPGSD